MILSLITLCRARGHYIYTPALAACLTMIIIDHSHWLYQQGEDELEILFLAKSLFRERKPHVCGYEIATETDLPQISL